jgi:hypothetical protein
MRGRVTGAEEEERQKGRLRSTCLRQLVELQGFSRSVGVSEAAAPVAVVAAYRVPANK